MKNRVLVSMLILFSAFPAVGVSQVTEPEELSGMSLEELLDLSIVTASNVSERLSDAPATVIVITAQQLRERGYSDLSQIFEDLPGMDVVRPFGATYLKNYWRGYRNTIGEPFLMMVDGIVFNHLYFNTADILTTFPLTNVDRVEVVYGPASSVYGANAFMGVVNVITRKAEDDQKGHGAATLSAGSFDRRLADATYAFRSEAFTLRIAARFDNGELDRSAGERYEYSKSRYYGDRALWGGFIDNPRIAGTFSSPHQHRAFDVRVDVGRLELGAQYFQLQSGYGVEYAADRVQTNAVWKRPELSLFGRYSTMLGRGVNSRTLLRYRRSDVSSDSFFLEAYTVPAADGTEQRVLDFSYWQSLNSSVSLNQDFDWAFSDKLSFNAGLKYEQKDLQKAYDTTYGPALPPSQIDASTYPYPDPPSESLIVQNRTTTEDDGVYLQARYAATPAHRFNVGVRWDNNSQYGDATTLRAGYVATLGAWRFKALYGEGFQEPTPRLLYGGWTGSGSDPDLVPERSRTFEVSAGHSRPTWATLASIYIVRNEETIVNTAAGAENIGERNVRGVDLHGELRGKVMRRSLRSWAYVSHIFDAEEDRFDDDATFAGTGNIGDLAKTHVTGGVTATLAPRMTTTLRGRYVSSRDTVVTNPVRRVPSFTTLDASFVADEILGTGIGMSVSLFNLFDEHYFHPGVRDADAGMTPGRFDSNGWHGSGGFFNSLLPQPGRSAVVTMRIGF